MVGVPYSKSCLSCKRRKKGCDEKKPSCTRCVQRGEPCDYAAKKWTFLNETGGAGVSRYTETPVKMTFENETPELYQSSAGTPETPQSGAADSIQADRSLVRSQDTTTAFQIKHGQDKVSSGAKSRKEIAPPDPARKPANQIRTPHMPPTVDRTAVQLSQLFAQYLYGNFPSDPTGASIVGRRSCLEPLLKQSLSDAPLLRYAIAAVCYGYLGGIHGRLDLLDQTRRCYGAVLRSLRRCMTSEAQIYDHETVLMSIHLLSLRNDGLGKSLTKDAWQSHYRGAEAYVKTRHMKDDQELTTTERLLFTNLRPPTLYICLANRETSLLRPKDWVNIPQMTRNQSHGEYLVFGFRLCAAVAQAEKACSDTQSKTQVLRAWETAQELNDQLQRFLPMNKHFAPLITDAEGNAVSASDGTKFDDTIEEHRAMMHSDVFSSLLYFHKATQIIDVFGIGQCWMFCLIANCTCLRLLHYNSILRRHVPQDTVASLKTSAMFYAKQICRSLFHLSYELEEGEIDFLNFLRSLAQSYFEEVNAIKEIEWCQSIEKASIARASRIHGSIPRTLCRLRDLTGSISTLARFRCPVKPTTR